MNGLEHYRRAEQLLSGSAFDPSLPPVLRPDEALILAQAQAHATLALTAAVAGLDVTGRNFEELRAWNNAIGGTS